MATSLKFIAPFLLCAASVVHAIPMPENSAEKCLKGRNVEELSCESLDTVNLCTLKAMIPALDRVQEAEIEASAAVEEVKKFNGAKTAKSVSSELQMYREYSYLLGVALDFHRLNAANLLVEKEKLKRCQ